MKWISIALAVGLSAATQALAQDRRGEWSFSHAMSASHPLNSVIETWAKSIEKASGGTIKVSPSPEREWYVVLYRSLREGYLDIVNTSVHDPDRYPVWAAARLPFLFADVKDDGAELD